MKRSTGIGAYIWKQLIRKKLFSVLAILLPAISILSITQISVMIRNNQKNIQTIYENAEIRCAVVKKADTKVNDYKRDLMDPVIKDLIESGNISDPNMEAIIRCDITVGDNIWKNEWMGGIMSMEGLLEMNSLGLVSIEWLNGYSGAFFEKSYENAMEYAREPEIVISEILSDAAQLKLGDYIDELRIEDGLTYNRVRVIGIVSGFQGEEAVLVPEDLIVHQSEGGILDVTYYRNIFFSIPSGQNVDYENVVHTIEQRLNHSDATMLKELELVVFDEELKIAIKPLAQTLKILETLKPFLFAAFGLCEAGLTGLFIVLRRKEIWIMKILGTSGWRIRLAICGEYFLTCVLGVLIGNGISGIIGSSSAGWGIEQLIFGIVLIGVSLGSSLVMLMITNRKMKA